jgi:hypothetical protein
MNTTEIDEAVEKRLADLMKNDPLKLLGYFVTLLGKEMLETNAGDLELGQSLTFEGKRYHVVVKASVTPDE